METWNYTPPFGMTKEYQEDWNQTLNTMLNSVSKDKEEPVLIKVPNKLKPIIETLAYYKNNNNNKIGNRYNVEFVDNDSNIIDVGGEKLEVLNY